MRRSAVVAMLVVSIAGAGLAACAGAGDSTGALGTAGGEGGSTTSQPADATGPTTTTTAVPGAGGDPLNGFEPAPLSWTRCGDGLECARLAVPIDWDAPRGDTIELLVAKVPATSGEAVGAIISNPGGPGGSGVQFITGGLFDERVSERFDTISWDPRGVAASAPLGCSDREIANFVRQDGDPDSAQEVAALDEAARAIGARCQAEAPELLAHMGTGSVARDLEAIRRAYGLPMSYIGFSYGTAIGLEYVELFPGAMRVVVDGVMDPALSLTDFLRGQAAAFERVVAEMLADCPGGRPGCPRGGAAAAYDALAAQVDQEPLRSGVDLVGPSELATAALVSVYSRSSWSTFHAALAAAQDGDGSIIMQLSVGYRFFTSYAAYHAVLCLDSEHPTGSEAWSAFAAELDAQHRRFGAMIANELRTCAFWPAAPDPITGPVVGEGAGPVVVVGTTGDAATPVEQAESAAARLADGRLIIFDGPGHTAFFSSQCVQDLVVPFLLDGTAPPDGARC